MDEPLGQKEIAGVVARIVNLEHPDEIYMFGSYAKGVAHASSDLDLLVVKNTSLPPSRRGRDVRAVLAPFASHFDVVVVTPVELERSRADGSSFIAKIFGEAKLLYRRPFGP